MAILTLADSNPNANTVAEDAANATVLAIDINASGGTGNYTFSIGYDPTGGAFAINASSGIVTVANGSLIDYEALVNGKLTLTIHAEDDDTPPNFSDINIVIDVTNVDGANFDGTTGADTIDDAGSFTTDTTDEEDNVDGLDDDDDISAAGGNDLVHGDDGDDTIDGGTGDDFLYGDAGDDIIVGGAGDDVIEGGDKNATGDDLDGGADIDTVSYQDSSAAVTIDLNDQNGVLTQSGGDAEDDILQNFENVLGSANDDEITGDDNDNVIEGGLGADALDGGLDGGMGDGFSLLDTVSYAGSSSAVTVTLGLNGDTTTGKGGDAEGDTLVNFENIIGSAGNDVLKLSEFGSVEGGAGADTLTGSGDDDETVRYSTSALGVTLTLGAAGKQTIGSGGDAQGDKVTNFDSIVGSNHNDKLTGNDGDNGLLGALGNDTLTGGKGDDDLIGDNFAYFPEVGAGIALEKSEQGGNDTLDGGDGDDTLLGGIGSDTIIGGAGIDTAIYQGSTKGVTIALAAKGAVSTQTGGDAAGDKLSLVENIIGSDSADTITGNELNNLIEGAGGADTLDGGAGLLDTVSYASAPDTGLDDDGVVVDLSKQDGVLTQAGDSDENGDILQGFENVIGSAFDDTLTGDGNANIIEGGAGKDAMDGAGGDDIVSYQNYLDLLDVGGVTITLDTNGDLTVVGSVGTDAEGDTGGDFEGIHGSAYDDVLTGNDSNNVIAGLAGDDAIAGGGGNDTLDGGEGVDTLDYSDAAGAVTVTLGATGKSTVVTATVDGEDSIVNFENVIGTALADTLTGNSLDNYFMGGDGDDIINGGTGNDTVDYSDGAVGITVALASGTGTAKVSVGDGDTISQIENVTGSTGDDSITGNSLANILDGGNGNDTIVGGAGADTLIGGDGNDTFKFSGTDGIGDTIDGGALDTDTIQITGTGNATIENFSADTGSIEVFTGNGQGILGTKNNNLLDFSGLTAYTSVEFVNGLAGNDIIVAFPNEQVEFLGEAGDDTLVGGNLADELDGGDGDDTLVGGAGNDTLLNGGKGDDDLTGEAGDDTLTGGAGIDRVDGGADNDTINIAGTDAEFDLLIGGLGATDTVVVTSAADVKLASFDGGGNGIEVFTGFGSTKILGNDDGNILDFGGMTMSGVSLINGGKGDDTITAADSDSTLQGGDGDDTLTGGTGINQLEGGKGIDVITGGANNDTILAGGTDAEFDQIDGGLGSNTLSVTGTAALTLNGFNGAVSNIDKWTGNGKALMGNDSNNTLSLVGLTTITSLLYVDGAAGDDILVASDLGNELRGGAGNDDLTGGTGKDTLNGGVGIDDIAGGDNDDRIQISSTEAQFDTIDGGNGNDEIVVLGSAAVTLDGFSATGADIELWTGNKKGVLGNQFGNTFDFSGLTNAGDIGVIDGAGGDDSITGSIEADDIRGGAGDDTLNGDDGNDTLNGGAGIDTVSGGDGDDTIVISGTEGQFDTIAGGANDDTLSFTSATVTLNGFSAAGTGIEIVSGKNTAILGNAGANSFDLSGLEAVSGLKSVDGGAGNDTIVGVDLTTYADDLRGNAGDDTLTGGKGNDKLAGGSGNDTFSFTTTDFGKDTISDFGSGFDVLDFTGNFADEDEVLDASTQVGTSVVITLDDSNTVTLQNYTLAQLEAAAAGGLILP